MTIEEFFTPVAPNKNQKFVGDSCKRISSGFRKIDKKFDEYCFENELSLDNNKHKYLDSCDYVEQLKNKLLDKEKRNTKSKFKFDGDPEPLNHHLGEIELMRETIKKQNPATWKEPIYCPRYRTNPSGIAGYKKVDDRPSLKVKK